MEGDQAPRLGHMGPEGVELRQEGGAETPLYPATGPGRRRTTGYPFDQPVELGDAPLGDEGFTMGVAKMPPLVS